MKSLHIIIAALFLLQVPGIGVAGEQERDTQNFGISAGPNPTPANVPDAAVIGGGILFLALIGGGAAGLGSGGGNTPVISTTTTN